MTPPLREGLAASLNALRTAGLIDDAQHAAATTARADDPLAWLAAHGGPALPDQLAAIGQAFALKPVDCAAVTPSLDALAQLDGKRARERRLLPLALSGDSLVVAVDNPLALDAVDTLAAETGHYVEPRLTSPQALSAALYAAYANPADSDAQGMRNDTTRVATTAHTDTIDLDLGPSEMNDPQEGPIIQFVQQLIVEAIRRRASDIHLEPMEQRFRVRFRIDGRLQTIENPPQRLQPAIISRLKLMADISIAEKRQPQDGRIRVHANGKELDLRVSCLPSIFGETIVMRILDREGLNRGLADLGLRSADEAAFRAHLAAPDGMFLVTGPTGSGKSTTLYAALHALNTPARKLITVEDPVEYQLRGVNQVQVHREVGMTFGHALRAMLRQAPNIIMVGEIRDAETAEVAIQAALTGHMVFSTLHTNDAPSAVTRLTDIGIPPFLVAAALRGVMAQRLVRRICPDCAQPHPLTAAECVALGLTSQPAGATPMRGAGCTRCNGRGYYGREGIFEILHIDDAMRDLINRNASLKELRSAAQAAGLSTLREDGIRKILAGVTTVEEVLSATVGD